MDDILLILEYFLLKNGIVALSLLMYLRSVENRCTFTRTVRLVTVLTFNV